MTLVSHLAFVSRKVSTSSARKAKVAALADALREMDPQDIEVAVHYLSGDLRQGKIGISFASLRAAAQAPSSPQSELTVRHLDENLSSYAGIRGAGSVAKRSALLADVFGAADVDTREFLFRLLTGELRQGALAGVMIEAIAAASQIDIKEIRRAAMYAPSLGRLAHDAISGGSAALAQYGLQLMSPVMPMLAQTAADVAEAIECLRTAIFEWKMDGARIQVHKAGNEVRIYTRSLNDVTAAVPEIEAAVRSLSARDLILDGEAISFSASGRPLSFQDTMRRFGRKLNIAAMQAEQPIQAFFFDCLLIDGMSIAELATTARIARLNDVVPTHMQMPRLVTDSVTQAQTFYEEALKAGHEGIMAKGLDAPYEAGNRGASWLKIKKAHTLDLVILAAEWGHGRRKGTLSNLHLGALDPQSGEFVMLGKTFKGLTDEMLAWQTRELLAREIERDHMTVYVRPELVVEIAFSDLQVSSRYPGGLALRLARVKRYRDDKSVQEADTMVEVRKLVTGDG